MMVTVKANQKFAANMDPTREQYWTAKTDSVDNGKHTDNSVGDTEAIIQDLKCHSVADANVSGGNGNLKSDGVQMQDSRGRRYNQSSIRSFLHPLLVCLSMFGCYDFYKLDKGYSKESRYLKSKVVGVYRILLFLVIVLAIAKFVSAFFYLTKPNIIPNSLFVAWLLMCLTYFVGQLKASNKKHGHQEKMFDQFDSFVDSIQHRGINFPVAQVRRRVIVGTIFGSALVLTNLIGIGLQIRFHTPSKEFYTAPFEPTLLAVSLFIFSEFILALVFIFSLIYNVTMCYITKQVCKLYNTYLQASVCNTNFAGENDIQKMRVLHLKLCDIVRCADADMSWFFASACVCNLALACFSLYQLVKAPLEEFSVFLYALWLLTAMVTLGLVTIFAAMVHEQAHAPLDIIYNIKVKNAGLDQVTQLQLFLSKLTGTELGFTTCGLLTITKEFILSDSFMTGIESIKEKAENAGNKRFVIFSRHFVQVFSYVVIGPAPRVANLPIELNHDCDIQNHDTDFELGDFDKIRSA